MADSDWPPTRLGELVEIKHGWPFKSEYFDNHLTGKPIVVSVGNFRYTGGFRFTETSVKEYGASYPKEYELAPRDILLVMTCQTAGGEILGIPARVPSDGRVYLHNQRLGKVVIRDRLRVDPDYLYWLFLWQDFNRELVISASGTKILHTAPSRIEAFHFYLPPLREQHAIAHILGTLDDKIELNRRMNETLEAMARALFKSWFVDFDPVRAKAAGRDTGLPKHIADLFPDSFEESELGEIPKGWRISTIRELASNIQYGLTQSATVEEIGPNFLRITDIQGGKVDWGTVPFCKVTPEEYERYRLHPGDVLVARTGASTGENIYLPYAPDAVFASYLVRFQFSDLGIARLAGAFMRTQAYFEYVGGCIGGSAQPNASAQALAGAQLVVPSREIARKFADMVRPLDLRIVENRDSSRITTALRDALLPKLISGELRVKDAERFIDKISL